MAGMYHSSAIANPLQDRLDRGMVHLGEHPQDPGYVAVEKVGAIIRRPSGIPPEEPVSAHLQIRQDIGGYLREIYSARIPRGRVQPQTGYTIELLLVEKGF